MHISEATIAATVTSLRDILQEAATLALSADAAFAAGNRNLAIGNLLPEFAVDRQISADRREASD